MVYRYESDEDAFLEFPRPGSDPSVPGTPPPPGPSPSRFPTPSLPPPVRRTPPPVEVAPAPAPAPARPGPAPAVARATAPPPPSAAAPHRPAAPPAATAAPHPAASTSAAPVIGTVDELDFAEPRAVDRKRGGRAWRVLIGTAAVVVLLALCGLTVAALLQDRTGTPQAGQQGEQPGVEQSGAADAKDLDSRDTDQSALTAKEVFPGRQLVVATGQPAYEVLKSQSSGSCAVAATGEIADLLVRLGCNQVVRATLRSPDGDYLLTAGLFNLTDVASAERVRDQLRQLLDERQGRLQGMSVDDSTEAVAKAAARVGWQVRGHYLAYCVVTRADGQRISSNDAKARDIMYDMIEVHLNRGVLERRANGGVASQPTQPQTDNTAGQDGNRNN